MNLGNHPHTPNHRPLAGAGAADVEFSEYPPYEARSTDYNIPERDDAAIMYDSVFVPDDTNTRFTSGASYNAPPLIVARMLNRVRDPHHIHFSLVMALTIMIMFLASYHLTMPK